LSKRRPKKLEVPRETAPLGRSSKGRRDRIGRSIETEIENYCSARRIVGSLTSYSTARHWGKTKKGMLMRISTAFVIVAGLSLGMQTLVQAQGAQPTAPPKAQSDQSGQSDQSNVIQSIQVVDIKDLRPEVKSKVEDVAAKSSEDDLRKLRDAIDATPEAVSAL
jgi:hypothetical protein